MLEYYEVNPLPEVCIKCMEENVDEDCGSCDYALDRWHLTRESEIRLDELIRQKIESAKQNGQAGA